MGRPKNNPNRTHTSAHAWRPMDRPASVPCTAPKGPYRGPHNRCTHETAPPAGYRRCSRDDACPIRLGRGRLCPWHEADAWDTDGSVRDRYELLMGARADGDTAVSLFSAVT